MGQERLIARRRWIAGLAGIALTCGAVVGWLGRDRHHYLDDDYAPFVALFPAPPARGSAQERVELDALLELQRARTPGDVSAAQVDRKTEIGRFAAVLGTDAGTLARLPHVQQLVQDVEDDARLYVRVAKKHFRRLRPREIEPAIQPCIGDVAADLSYPSGHATYGYLVGYLLADMVPARRAQLLERAAGFARQRMVCGVHFPSDVWAGRIGAEWLMQRLRGNPRFVAARERAAQELRAALAQRSGHSSAIRAPPRLALDSAVTRPRCSRATRATIASPSPKPPVSRLRLVSSRVNAWNTEARCSSGIPSPSSSTASRQTPASHDTSMVTSLRA
jgi:acid phosphatase (class A)